MPGEDLTIFDIPRLGEAESWVRVRATTATHPFLAVIYDETFLADDLPTEA
jgi:hypothetical protein